MKIVNICFYKPGGGDERVHFFDELTQEGITSGIFQHHTPELTMKIFFHGTKVMVVLILDPNVSLDTDELIEDGFRIIWNGLTTEYFLSPLPE